MIVRVSALVLLLLAPRGVCRAAEERVLLGATLGVESPSDASSQAPVFLDGEVLARVALGRTLRAELAVGYRHTSFSRLAGTSGEEYALTQVPLLVGLRYVFRPERTFRVLPGGGVRLAASRLTYSSYLYSTSLHRYVTDAGSSSRLVLGAYLGVDAELWLGRSVALLGGVSYAYNPIAPPYGPSSSRDYGRLYLGVGGRL